MKIGAILLLLALFNKALSYSLTPGLFTTTETFHLGPEGAFRARVKPGDPARYEIIHSGSVVATTWNNGYDNAFAWNLFPGGKFLAVRLVRISGGFADFRIDVWDVSNPGNPVDVSPLTGLLSGSRTAQLHLDPSTDGMAYHLWLGERGNRSKYHKVYRSDNGNMLCAGLPSNARGQRLAEHANGNVRIFISPGDITLGSCELS